MGTWRPPAEHQYQPVSFLSSFIRVTVKTPLPSSKIVTEGCCGGAMVRAEIQEWRFPLSHHFFSALFSLSWYKQGMLTLPPSSTDTLSSVTDKSGGSEVGEESTWNCTTVTFSCDGAKGIYCRDQNCSRDICSNPPHKMYFTCFCSGYMAGSLNVPILHNYTK